MVPERESTCLISYGKIMNKTKPTIMIGNKPINFILSGAGTVFTLAQRMQAFTGPTVRNTPQQCVTHLENNDKTPLFIWLYIKEDSQYRNKWVSPNILNFHLTGLVPNPAERRNQVILTQPKHKAPIQILKKINNKEGIIVGLFDVVKELQLNGSSSTNGVRLKRRV